MSRFITLGGIILDVSNGTSLRVVEETSWDDAPSVRAGLQARSGQDGAWDSAGFNAERVVDIFGLVQESATVAAYAMSRALTALHPGSVFDLIVADDDIGIQSVTGRITIGAKFNWLDEQSFTYNLQLTAPDPLKYGTPTFGTATLAASTPGAGRVWPRVYPTSYGIAPGVIPGAVPVANAGTAAYWPRLRIDGPVTNPVVSLAESGAWVRYGGSLTLGQWLDIDCANRTVLLQGVVSMRQKVTSYGDWLAISPGGGSIAWTADTADSAALLTVYAKEGAWS